MEAGERVFLRCESRVVAGFGGRGEEVADDVVMGRGCWVESRVTVGLWGMTMLRLKSSMRQKL